jgi:hypothetical protein
MNDSLPITKLFTAGIVTMSGSSASSKLAETMISARSSGNTLSVFALAIGLMTGTKPEGTTHSWESRAKRLVRILSPRHAYLAYLA